MVQLCSIWKDIYQFVVILNWTINPENCLLCNKDLDIKRSGKILKGFKYILYYVLFKFFYFKSLSILHFISKYF